MVKLIILVFINLVALAILVNACGELRQATQLILRGGNVPQRGVPWHVSVYKKSPGQNKTMQICGGSIIEKNVILSAAHCFSDSITGVPFPADQFFVGAGKYYRDYSDARDTHAEKRAVQSITLPSKYHGLSTNLAADLAIIVLKESLPTNEHIHPVCIDWLNTDQQLTSGSIGLVAGVGIKNGHDDSPIPSDHLKQLEVPFIDSNSCFEKMPQSYLPFLTLDKFCAGWNNGSSVCMGDGGGGIAFLNAESQKYYIRGIVSSSPSTRGGCDSRYPATYTQISSYINLISEKVNENRV